MAILIVAAIIINDTQTPETTVTEVSNEADQIRPLGEDDFIDALYKSLRLSFEHTVPGEYSEIIVSDRAFRGEEVEFVLYGPDEVELNRRTVTAGDDGTIYFTFKVYTYGTYEVRNYHPDSPSANQYVTVE